MGHGSCRQNLPHISICEEERNQFDVFINVQRISGKRILYLGPSKRTPSSSAGIQVYRLASPPLRNEVGRRLKYELSKSSSY